MKNKKIILVFFLLILSIGLIDGLFKISKICTKNTALNGNLSISSFNDKYSLEWNFTWGGLYYQNAHALNYDSIGNVYITGMTNSTFMGNTDIFLAKFNSSGHFQWNRTFGGAGTDIVYGIALDSEDNIYLGGQMDMGAGNSDFLLVKYNSLGEYQWNKTRGTGDSDFCHGIALDSADNIYLGGALYYAQTSLDICLMKFNSLGEYQWNRTRGGDYNDMVFDIVLDSSDNIYMAGYIDHMTSNVDMCLIKYNNLGEYQWNRTYDHCIYDEPRSIALDSENNIYVSVRTTNDTMFLDIDTLLLKYDSTGVLQLNQTWELSDIYGIDLDIEDTLYLAGTLNYSVAKNYDFCLIQFNSTSKQYFNYTWGGSRNDAYIDIVIDASDNIYLTGIRDDFDIHIEKYLRKDTTPPYIWINSPLSGEIFEIDAPTFNLTITDANLHMCWYTINESIAIMVTPVVSGINIITINQSLWDNLLEGQVNVRFFVNDTAGNVNNKEITIFKRFPQNGLPIIPFGNFYIIVIVFSVAFLIFKNLKRKKLL